MSQIFEGRPPLSGMYKKAHAEFGKANTIIKLMQTQMSREQEVQWHDLKVYDICFNKLDWKYLK
jgi:hypothetical protein